MKINRNDPCPCGSGQKFKKCHLGREAEIGLAPSTPTTPGAVAQGKPPLDRNIIYGYIAVVVLGAVAATFAGHFDWGVAGGFAALIAGAAYLVLRDPPPPNKDRSDPSQINFGN